MTWRRLRHGLLAGLGGLDSVAQDLDGHVPLGEQGLQTLFVVEQLASGALGVGEQAGVLRSKLNGFLEDLGRFLGESKARRDIGHDPHAAVIDLARQGLLPADLVGETGGRHDRLPPGDAGLGADWRHDPLAQAMMDELRKNCAEFGITFFDRASGKQGIVHIVGPEQGITQPGTTIACGDSHTSTHGAFAALAGVASETNVASVSGDQVSPLLIRVRTVWAPEVASVMVFPSPAAAPPRGRRPS